MNDPAKPVAANDRPPSRTNAVHRQGHRQALLVMVICTVLWSTAGVATRQLDHTEGFEIAFWRSMFCALFVFIAMSLRHGSGWVAPLRGKAGAVTLSGAMWAVMFTCFMVALTHTSVANVMVVLAASPLLAALLGLAILKEPVPGRTWVAIALAGLGLVWMVREGLSTQGLAGMAIAFGVPVASAINLVLLKRTGSQIDLVPAVLLGALISAAITLPLAWPLSASGRDLAILAGLGVFQLALPCMLMVNVAHRLAPYEIALLGLLEMVLAPVWAWLGAGERPGAHTVQGGALVLAALAFNELLAQRERRQTDAA